MMNEKPRNMTKEKPKCCYLTCDKEAEWSIFTGMSPDDETEACTKHVGELLTDAPINYVSRLEQ